MVAQHGGAAPDGLEHLATQALPVEVLLDALGRAESRACVLVHVSVEVVALDDARAGERAGDGMRERGLARATLPVDPDEHGPPLDGRDEGAQGLDGVVCSRCDVHRSILPQCARP